MGLLVVIVFVIGASLILSGWLQRGRELSISDAERAYEEVIQSQGFAGEAISSVAAPSRRASLVDSVARVLERNRLFGSREATETVSWLERELIMAGRPGNWSATEAAAAALIWWACVAAGSVLLFSLGFPKILLIVTFVALMLYPPLKLRQAKVARQGKAWAELPVFINEMIMGLTGGLTTIDDALGRVVSNTSAAGSQRVLVQEFGQAYAEYRHGNRDREEALRGAAERLGVQAVDNFVDALVQGLRTGSPIRGVLESQSQQSQAIFKQEMRAFIAKKESSFVISLFLVMFGIFIMAATPIFLQVFSTFD